MSSTMSPERVSQIFWRVLFVLGGAAIAIALTTFILEVIDRDVFGAVLVGIFLVIWTWKVGLDVRRYRRRRKTRVVRRRVRPATIQEVSARVAAKVKRDRPS